MGKLKYLVFYELRNLVKVRWLWLYLGMLLASNFALLYVSEDLGKVILSSLSITLLLVPLVSAFFSLVHFYDAKNFIRFLISQPIGRSHIFLGKWLALTLFMASLYALGVLLPLAKGLLNSQSALLILSLTLIGMLLSVIFVSIALLVGVLFEDRVKGVSFLISLCIYLSFLHDGLILSVVYLFRDYPLEKVVLALTLLNPIDLARLAIILNMDLAALMGISEAVFKGFLGSPLGVSLSLGVMVLWVLIPTATAVFLFNKKDF